MSSPASKLSSSSELSKKFFSKILLPGDVLVYSRPGVFGWIIRHATNGNATHTEMYMGGDKTIAARDGKQVGTYDLDVNGLYAVLRPKQTIDMAKVAEWQKTVEGQKYDWLGLLRSFVANKWFHKDEKMWCSEHTTLGQRAGGIEPFSGPEDTPADSVAPSDFLQSAAYHFIYKKAK